MHTDRRWSFGISAPALWELMAGVGEYRRWWPWLRGFEAGGLVEGDVWRCVVQPPLPYRLRFWVGLDQVVAGRLVAATVGGDLNGSARLEIEDRARGCCEARLVAALAPRSPTLRVVTALAQPMARFGHDWILDTGAHQFARQVASPLSGRCGR